MTAVAKPDLTADEARELVAEVVEALEEVSTRAHRISGLLTVAREQNAPKALGYETWDAFVKGEFGLSQAHGYRLLDYAKVMAELGSAVGLTGKDLSLGGIREREARGLKPGLAKTVRAVKKAAAHLPADAPPEKRAEVLRETLDRRAADPRVEKAPPRAPVAATPPPAPVGAVPPPDAPEASSPARWRELLGDALAARVAALVPADPARFCVDAVREAVRSGEAVKAKVAKARKPARCSHPDNRRSPNGRCKDCGEQTGVVFRSARG